ncbi:MAG TPA: efflux RND transporter periplasmic adaptor subunit [Sinorhizobium sp.]|nr:efflux RND transporter periplasmic adaptor subunit [Sinorhizobium sp.]
MKKTWLWTPALLVVLAAASYGIFLYLTPRATSPGFLYGNGHIEGTEVRIGAEVAGRIVETRLVEGSTIVKGDVLLQIDDQDLQIRVAQAKAQETAIDWERGRIEEELQTARHHLETTQRDVRRYRDLQERGTASPQRLEQSENAFQEARGRVNAMQTLLSEIDARLEAARQNTRFIRSQMAKTEVRAPISGTILIKAIEAGEFVSAGQTVAVLVDLTRLELRLFIPEKDIGKVKLGDSARVRSDAFPDRYAEARVARIDQRAQFTPRDIHMPEERVRMVFGVTLALDNPRGEFKPGMPADAWIRWNEGTPWPERLAVAR